MFLNFFEQYFEEITVFGGQNIMLEILILIYFMIHVMLINTKVEFIDWVFN